MKVLLVVDAQNCYAPDGVFPVVGWAESHANLQKLVASWNGEVVFFKHHAEGTPFDLARDTSLLSLEHGDWPVVAKRFASCYTETDLDEMLENLKERLPAADRHLRIYHAGFMTNHCVITTALESAAHGESLVVSDACGNPDIAGIGGLALHGAALAAMTLFYTQAVTTAEALEIP